MLHSGGDALYQGIFFVFFGAVRRVEVHAEKSAERLPHSGTKCAEKGFHNVVGGLVGFAVDEFYHHFALVFGEFFHHRFILGIERLFKLLELGVFFFFGVESFMVFIGFLKGAVNEFGVG